MFKFKMTDLSQYVPFVNKSGILQTFVLLQYCRVTKTFWEAFSSWLNSHPPIIMDIFLGVFNMEEDWITLNHLKLIAKLLYL